MNGIKNNSENDKDGNNSDSSLIKEEKQEINDSNIAEDSKQNLNNITKNQRWGKELQGGHK